MVQPTNGQLVTDSAIGGFIGADGKGVEWEKQKDGSYTAECKVPLAFDEKGKVQGEVKYTYFLTPNGRGFLEVGVSKVKLLTKEQAVVAELENPGNTVAVPEKDLKKGGKAKGK